jgi:hypothetical protein
MVRLRILFLAVLLLAAPFAANSTSEAKVVELSRPMKLILTHAESSHVELPAYGVEIFSSPQH